MNLKKLLATFAIALVIILAGCAKDDVVETVGVCPVVLLTAPDNGDVDVPLDQVITVTFNEEVDPETINEQNFTVEGATSIDGTVSASGEIASFIPSDNLEPNTTYTGMVTTSVKDPMGNALQENYIWTFTTIPEVTLSVSPEAGGTLTGAGTFADGSLVTVSAIPNDGFTFTNWTVGETVVSTSSSYQFEMDGNTELLANFTAVTAGKLTVNLSSFPSAGGTTSGSGQFSANSTVTVAALPNPGYVFVNWTEDETIVSTSSSYQFVLTANRTLIANYSLVNEDQFAVILSANPAEGGSINGSGSYDAEEDVTVTATPNNGYAFVNWTANGEEVSTDSSYTFVITANTNLVANFEVAYTLNVTAQNGVVSKNPNQSTYNNGDSVELTATPDNGYEFTSWSGDASGSNNPLTVVMNSNKNITANFILTNAKGPGIIDLGTAGDFVILSKSGIDRKGVTSITGNIGVSPIDQTALTGFSQIMDVSLEFSTSDYVVGKIYAADYATPTPSYLTTAISDQETAFSVANGLTTNVIVDLGAGDISGKTLAPGLYKWGTGLLITNAGVTLNGGPDDTWVFQISDDFTIDNDAIITLAGGAQAKNIFWVTKTQAVIGSNVQFKGNVLAKTLISVNTGAIVSGVLLSQTAVTLNASTVVKP
jgi:hypothetical protein